MWEEKYDKFVSYDGMPEVGTPLYKWQSQQLSKQAYSLNAKIWKELAENEGNMERTESEAC